jgi:hypothetical protein
LKRVSLGFSCDPYRGMKIMVGGLLSGSDLRVA